MFSSNLFIIPLEMLGSEIREKKKSDILTDLLVIEIRIIRKKLVVRH